MRWRRLATWKTMIVAMIVAMTVCLCQRAFRCHPEEEEEEEEAVVEVAQRTLATEGEELVR